MNLVSSFLGNLKVFKKMLVVAIVTLVSMIILTFILIYEQKKVMVNEKKAQLVNIIELSYSLIDKEYKNFKNGKISENEAKEIALSNIKNLRYEENNYIWINDAQLPYPKMIMHPTSPSLNGEILNLEKFNVATQLEFGLGLKDVETVSKKNLFQASVEITKKSNFGFVEYSWEKSDNKLHEKLSFVKKYEPWNWVLGTGIYMDDVKEEFYNSATKALEAIIVIVLILFVLFYIITKEIVFKVSFIDKGLENFFSYLNRETNEIIIQRIDSKDEFGNMSKLINTNIEKAQKGINEDRTLIDDTINMLEEFEQGNLSQRLQLDVSNPVMMQLKNVLNKMAENFENNVDNILNILEKYSKFNYLEKVDTNGIKADLLELATGVNTLGESITSMLVENKSNGITLHNSSAILLENVEKLNKNAIEAASSLEETAAALEQITGNIKNNTENITKMAEISHNVTISSSNGEKLANDTVIAMEDIDTQVRAINESISIIDQIAFQTNILSLNAAVEAATAGEAGKGFTVVAQEVRNLATRSSEAAKEIKDMVENATKKANEGKSIATNMITGYKTLNNDITRTIELISEVEGASKEQLSGIEQINNAIAQLDQQTQQNAEVASKTHNIAISTDSIANLVVKNANEKEFEGKDSVKGKFLNTNNSQNIKMLKEPIVSKEFNSQKSNEEWENF